MTEDFPHLSRAPIKEALLDIRIEPEIPFEKLHIFDEAAMAEYPNKKDRNVTETKFSLGGGDTKSVHRKIGYIYTNSEKTRSVQARCNGFTMNIISSYKDWKDLRDEAEEYWNKYVQMFSPPSVIRCALRYINRIEVPVGEDLSNIIHTRVEINDALPSNIDEYFLRVVLPFEENRKAIIIQSVEPPSGESSNTRGMILDIEAFTLRKYVANTDEIWTEMSALRRIKNQCFFKTLDDTVLERYK